MHALLLCCVLLVISTGAADPIPSTIHCNNQTVVSGLSSGAFMAAQFHVAYSSSLIGAGIIAGGPFYCAQDQVDLALTDCMNSPDNISVADLQAAAQACESLGLCDSFSYFNRTRAWIFSGTGDTVVDPGVVNKLVEFLTPYLGSSNIYTKFDLPAEHSWPTISYGNQCSYLGSPYMNACSYNAALAMLHFLYGSVHSPGTSSPSNLIKVDQQPYTPNQEDPSSISMGPQALMYVPQSCNNNPSSPCRLVVALHGCQQTIDDIGTDLALNTGLNDLAETNRLVILYPQAIKSYYPISNPEGCWDWWGYTDSNYSNKKGVQMQTVYNMIQALTH